MLRLTKIDKFIFQVMVCSQPSELSQVKKLYCKASRGSHLIDVVYHSYMERFNLSKKTILSNKYPWAYFYSWFKFQMLDGPPCISYTWWMDWMLYPRKTHTSDIWCMDQMACPQGTYSKTAETRLPRKKWVSYSWWMDWILCTRRTHLKEHPSISS